MLSTVVFVGMLAAVGMGAELQPDRIRAYDIQDDGFDYVFTAAAQSGEGHVLSFNDRQNRTSFVRVGQPLGAYRVETFSPRTEKVFNPSVNRSVSREAGVVVLSDAAGKLFTLKPDKRLTLPGYRVKLVLLDTGEHGEGRVNDRVTLADVDVTIRQISEGGVSLSIGSYTWEAPLLSEVEREELTQLLRARRAAQQERQRIAQAAREQARKEADAAAVARKMADAPVLAANMQGRTRRVGPQWFFGTEYRYPTAYDVIPPTFDSNGRMVFGGLVIPKDFETRMVGMGMNVRAYPVFFGAPSVNLGGAGMGAGGGMGVRANGGGGMNISIDANQVNGRVGSVRF